MGPSMGKVKSTPNIVKVGEACLLIIVLSCAFVICVSILLICQIFSVKLQLGSPLQDQHVGAMNTQHSQKINAGVNGHWSRSDHKRRYL